jgi:hypothetical protein
MTKLIIRTDTDSRILAVRAARWLESLGPDQKDGIVSYENGVDLYVKRNESGSITVREVKRA